MMVTLASSRREDAPYTLRYCERELEGLRRVARDKTSVGVIQRGSRSVDAGGDCGEVDVLGLGGIHCEVNPGTSALVSVIGHGQSDCSRIPPVDIDAAHRSPRDGACALDLAVALCQWGACLCILNRWTLDASAGPHTCCLLKHVDSQARCSQCEDNRDGKNEPFAPFPPIGIGVLLHRHLTVLRGYSSIAWNVRFSVAMGVNFDRP